MGVLCDCVASVCCFACGVTWLCVCEWLAVVVSWSWGVCRFD